MLLSYIIYDITTFNCIYFLAIAQSISVDDYQDVCWREYFTVIYGLCQCGIEKVFEQYLFLQFKN